MSAHSRGRAGEYSAPRRAFLDSHLRWFAEKGKNGRVIVGHKGATPRRTNFQKHWRNALVKAKLDQSLHLHDLRHTGNTLSAHTGASLRELMARAGHIRGALGYLHAVEERNRAIADGLSELVKKTPKEAAKKKRAGTPEARRRIGACGPYVARAEVAPLHDDAPG